MTDNTTEPQDEEGDERTVTLTVDEGTLMLMLAAYALGKGRSKAIPPGRSSTLMTHCIDLISADTEADATEVVARFIEAEKAA